MERTENMLEQMLEGELPVGFRLHVVCKDNKLTITSDFPFDDGYLESLADAVMVMSLGMVPDCDEWFAFGNIQDRREFLGGRYRARRAMRMTLTQVHVTCSGHPVTLLSVSELFVRVVTYHAERPDETAELMRINAVLILLYHARELDPGRLVPGCLSIDRTAADACMGEIRRLNDAGGGPLHWMDATRGALLEATEQMALPCVGAAEEPISSEMRRVFSAKMEALLPSVERSAAAEALGRYMDRPSAGMSEPRWRFVRQQLEAMTRA